MSEQPISVAVVDDHPVVIEGLRRLIEQQPDMRFAGSASSLGAARQLIAAEAPDVVLCDVMLGRTERGFDLLDGDRAIVLLSSYDYPSLIALAIERGASGYLDKSSAPAVVVDTIRRAARGEAVFARQALAAARRTPRRPSARELQVIALVANERTTLEIAHALKLSDRTVETHLHRMFQRYGVSSRTGLAMLAVREGWLKLRDASSAKA
jgi:DNA-binding NarL/FixJ family response regulator